MAQTELGELFIRLKAQGQAEVDKALKGVGLSMDKLAKGAAVAGAAIGAGIVGTFALVVKNTIEAEQAFAQLEQRVKSTGGVAGFSATQLASMASDLQAVSTYGDDAIQSMQSVLLTFTQVRGDQFKGAQQAILDMSTALGTDLKSAALQVGKALNDPAKGVAALARAGVQLTAQQQEMVAQMVATGDVAGAQAVILKELEVQFGGAAKAARNTLGGALEALKNSFGDLFEVPGMVRPITDEINRLVAFLSKPETQAAVQGFIRTTMMAFGVLASSVVEAVARVLDVLSIVPSALAKIPGPTQATMVKVRDAIEGAAVGAQRLANGIQNTTDRIAEAQGPAESTAQAIRSIGEAASAATPAVKDLGETFGGRRFGQIGEELARINDEINKANASQAAGRKPLELMVPVTPKLVVPDLPALTESELAEVAEYYRKADFGTAVGNAMVDSIVGGIEQAVASGSISEGFQALTAALLSGLGSAMIRFGQSSAAFATLMDDIMKGLSSLLPGGALAASLAMIGIGAALKGVAGGMFGGRRGGGASVGGLGGSMLAGRGSDTYTRVSLPPTATAMGAGVNPLPPMSFNIIGPNDPVAQRQITELVTRAGRR